MAARSSDRSLSCTFEQLRAGELNCRLKYEESDSIRLLDAGVNRLGPQRENEGEVELEHVRLAVIRHLLWPLIWKVSVDT